MPYSILEYIVHARVPYGQRYCMHEKRINKAQAKACRNFQLQRPALTRFDLAWLKQRKQKHGVSENVQHYE